MLELFLFLEVLPETVLCMFNKRNGTPVLSEANTRSVPNLLNLDSWSEQNFGLQATLLNFFLLQSLKLLPRAEAAAWGVFTPSG